jgi:hypothetical protein
MTDRTVRLGGVSGIVFLVLIFITAVSTGEPPDADGPADKIRTYLVDKRSALLVSTLLGLVAIPFLVWFFVVLREQLRGDQLSNALGTAALAGLLLTASMALAGGAVIASAVYVDGVADRLGDDTTRIVFEAQNLLFASTSAGIVLLAVASALAIRRTGALPSFTMWLALLAAVTNIATMLSTLGAGAANLGFVGFLGFALFILVTGITMATGRASRASAV